MSGGGPIDGVGWQLVFAGQWPGTLGVAGSEQAVVMNSFVGAVLGGSQEGIGHQLSLCSC